MKIGVISDTHNKFDPRIPELFSGVDAIIHAGDVGDEWILDELKAVAPVTAVIGNTDQTVVLPDIAQLSFDKVKFLVAHIVDEFEVQKAIITEKPDIVIHGHLHQVRQEFKGKTFYFNPGSASQGRGSPRSIGFIDIFNGTFLTRIVDLDALERR
ncbi:MAG: metallophosphoesterase family protein [Verrucomicrobiota bacterium]|nr:metallophosphoesterase family protein [Verrucomicrobiota bacterium]